MGSLRSVFIKIDRIHYFDIRYSLFDIRYSLFYSFFLDLTGRFFGQRRRLYETTCAKCNLGRGICGWERFVTAIIGASQTEFIAVQTAPTIHATYHLSLFLNFLCMIKLANFLASGYADTWNLNPKNCAIAVPPGLLFPSAE